MASSTLEFPVMCDLVTEILLGPDFRRAIFAGTPRNAPSPWVKVVIRPIAIRGTTTIQLSYFDGRKDISKNAADDEVRSRLDEILAVGYSGIHLWTATQEIEIRMSKKGKILCTRRPVAASASLETTTHNRTKDQPLPEGRADRLLETLGIMTDAGQVRPTMRAKYTQINEFLKHLTHVSDDAGLRDLGRPVVILDCGCGSSYLTLATHHYLNDVLAIPAKIIGVDVNEEVIRKSIDRAERLQARELTFTCGRIGAMNVAADIVLALHACDTATDDAIAQAIRSEARVLLSVPCCHHHLNDQIQAQGAAEVLRPLLRHPILQQRTADLVTDAFRALALRIMGYRTEVIEFVSPEHTARNLMIRAVRSAPRGELSFIREYRSLEPISKPRLIRNSRLG